MVSTCTSALLREEEEEEEEEEEDEERRGLSAVPLLPPRSDSSPRCSVASSETRGSS